MVHSPRVVAEGGTPSLGALWGVSVWVNPCGTIGRDTNNVSLGLDGAFWDM